MFLRWVLILLAVAGLAAYAIHREQAGESAAWAAILMAIVNAIKERMSSVDIDTLLDGV